MRIGVLGDGHGRSRARGSACCTRPRSGDWNARYRADTGAHRPGRDGQPAVRSSGSKITRRYGWSRLPRRAHTARLIVNATAGTGSLSALEAAGAANLAGKVLVDMANPLDFSQGFPPLLSVANADSLGEQIQRAFPDARVVKTLNTMNALRDGRAARVPGAHNVFLAGEDAAAKKTVKGLLREFGWPEESILDLGRHPGGPGHRDVPAALALAHGRARYRRLQHPGRQGVET